MEKKELEKAFELIFKTADDTKAYWEDTAGEYYREIMKKYSEEVKTLLEGK